VNIALPAIALTYHTTASASIWIVNAFQFAVMATLIPAASAARIIGETRLFRIGLAVFVVASCASSLAPSLSLLAGARLLQGIATACLWASFDTITRHATARGRLGQAVGWLATCTSGGQLAGPILGGLILSFASWQFIFVVNVPIVMTMLLSSTKTLPSMKGLRRRYPWRSAVLNIVAMGLLVGAFVEWGHRETLVASVCMATGALVAGAILIRSQRRAAEKLLDFELFRLPLFRLSIVASLLAHSAQMAAFIALPFLLEKLDGFSVLETGLLILPWLIGAVGISPISGRLADLSDPGRLAFVGLLTAASGMVLLAALNNHATILELVVSMALCGIGYGLFQSPNNRSIIISAPPDKTAHAAGIRGTARLLGQMIGASVAALLLATKGHSDAAITFAQVTLVLHVGAALFLSAAIAVIARASSTSARYAPAVDRSS
jgi:DHA2 family multidrug resistance protein-like MFS transporter